MSDVTVWKNALGDGVDVTVSTNQEFIDLSKRFAAKLREADGPLPDSARLELVEQRIAAISMNCMMLGDALSRSNMEIERLNGVIFALYAELQRINPQIVQPVGAEA